MTLKHESSIQHVTGQAIFVNDMLPSSEILYGYVVYSKKAHAIFTKPDVSEALKVEGVYTIVTKEDIPGSNQMGPVVADEPCLADSEVVCVGQAIALIAAVNKEVAIKAASLIKIDYKDLPAITSIEESMKQGNELCEPRRIIRGDIQKGFSESEFILEGKVTTGAQEHWYLETQTALAIPGEAKEMRIHASSQHPSETQAVVANVLGIDRNNVNVEVKRIGGGFGGKETQGNHCAAWAALLAYKTMKATRIHLSRDDDQIMTGKRHRYLNKYRIGFDKEGFIRAYEVELNADAGYATDLSRAILDRALFHCENAYNIPNFSATGHLWKTNLPSNTAFRGFGGPQGMAVVEQAVDHMARFLGEDPALLRTRNFYSEPPKNITPYRQIVPESPLVRLAEKLLKDSDYIKRREKVRKFNKEHEFIKKGISFAPVKFGISFTTSFLNQASALVNIYQDGSVLLHHGGTEMGQGLHTKIISVASKALGIGEECFRLAATNTNIVPNTSATAASTGSDLNGMAVKNAIDKLKHEISKAICGAWKCDEIMLDFHNGIISHPNDRNLAIPFRQAIRMAYLKQVPLSSSGYYSTPGLNFDPKTGQGNAFHYFVYTMAVSEVECNMLDGNVKVLQTDILHEAGKSINAAIDKGQIIGGFVQGLGWVSSEIVQWDDQGNLKQFSPGTYKIPTIGDVPAIMNIEIINSLNQNDTIYESKAVGEPPFMLAFSVLFAIRDALHERMSDRQISFCEIPASYEWVVKNFRDILTRSIH